MTFASFVVQSSIGKNFVQTLQYKVVMELLCASSVAQSNTVKCLVQALQYKVVLGGTLCKILRYKVVRGHAFCASFEVQSSIGKNFVQALQYKVVLESSW